MNPLHTTALALALVLATTAHASASEKPGIPPAQREFIEWTDLWIPGADKSDKPRVLLVGDSVTKGYYNNVEKLLKADAYVGRLATSLCAGDPAFIPTLKAALMQAEFDVIHFNNGLHGVGYSEKEYAAGYRAAIQAIRQLQPKAKIVVALTTPLKKASSKDNLNPRIDERNRIAKIIAKEIAAPIDDLNTPLRNHPELHRDAYHFNQSGIAVQAKQVARAIRKVLGKSK